MLTTAHYITAEARKPASRASFIKISFKTLLNMIKLFLLQMLFSFPIHLNGLQHFPCVSRCNKISHNIKHPQRLIGATSFTSFSYAFHLRWSLNTCFSLLIHISRNFLVKVQEVTSFSSSQLDPVVFLNINRDTSCRRLPAERVVNDFYSNYIIHKHICRKNHHNGAY